jgi:hypothetical protein
MSVVWVLACHDYENGDAQCEEVRLYRWAQIILSRKAVSCLLYRGFVEIAHRTLTVIDLDMQVAV